MSNISVIGAGGWGLALANIFSEKHNIKVWVHSEKSYKLLNENHRNDNYLKNIELNKNIFFTMDIKEVVNDSEIIIIVTPSFAFYEACKNIEPFIKNEQILISATKGLDRKTGKTMSEVARSVISGDLNILTLSGPSQRNCKRNSYCNSSRRRKRNFRICARYFNRSAKIKNI